MQLDGLAEEVLDQRLAPRRGNIHQLADSTVAGTPAGMRLQPALTLVDVLFHLPGILLPVDMHDVPDDRLLRHFQQIIL